MTPYFEDYLAIISVLNTYAKACDDRDWELLDRVFTEDVTFDSATLHTEGRKERVESMRGNLGGCGPTQHLLGNFEITVDRDDATCTSSVRALHTGAGDRSHLTYELFGRYNDNLRRTTLGWRIYQRRMEVRIEIGSRDVLRP